MANLLSNVVPDQKHSRFLFSLALAASLAGCSHVSPQKPAAEVSAQPQAKATPSSPAKPQASRIRYSQVKTNEMALAMTFDDGPHPVNTPKLLDLLKERNIKATFFLVGQRVKMHPEIVRRIIAEGHEVANHTWTHPSLVTLSDEKVHEEFQRTATAIWDAAQYRPVLMRPPYGATNKHVEQSVHDQFGYKAIIWSVDPNDWRRPGVDVVADRLIAGAHKGAIMLSHDIHAPTIQAMPRVFDTLLAKGYKFVTVSQLIELDQPAAAVATTPSS